MAAIMDGTHTLRCETGHQRRSAERVEIEDRTQAYAD